MDACFNRGDLRGGGVGAIGAGSENLCAAAQRLQLIRVVELVAGKQSALFQVSQPGYVFLTHTAGNESFPGITARFVQFAERNGFRRIHQQVFADTNGRNTVETFQFAPAARLVSPVIPSPR